jgi:BirA family biotin operon repressor/biotin-[acetyl-CoA-carboxylase] ligase
VLIELRAEAGGPAHVIIGVGINVTLSEPVRREIEASGTAAAAVSDACTSPPSRNLAAGAILDELLSMLLQYERYGFSAFRDEWTALDGLKDRSAQIAVGGTVICGVARGVDSDGALLLETKGCMQRFVSGEASLRLAQG